MEIVGEVSGSFWTLADKDGDFFLEPYADEHQNAVVRLFRTAEEAEMYRDVIEDSIEGQVEDPPSFSVVVLGGSEDFKKIKDQLIGMSKLEELADTILKVDLCVIMPEEWPKSIETLWESGFDQ